MEPIIHAQELQKFYGKTHALKGLYLAVKPGEVFGLIGPNGAGKTTTVRILLGLLKASGGTAEIFGMDAWQDAATIHKRLAYVPDDVRLWGNLTGGEVIDFLLNLRGGIDEKRRSHYIDCFDFDPAKRCRAYSKGNRQKVALIAALASKAELLVLDEPTGGLDPLMARRFQETIQEIKNEGRTVLLSSHRLADVERLCDRVAIISQGTIVESGDLKTMRHMKRNVIRVRTRDPLDGLQKLNGVHDVIHTDDEVSFQADNEELEAIYSFLAARGILSLISSPPTLEDLFMRHYETRQESTGAAEDG